MGLIEGDDRLRVLEALGYPLVDSIATWSSALPVDRFQIHESIDSVVVAFTADRVRSLCVTIEEFDCKIRDGADNSAVDSVDGTHLRSDHLKVLREERFMWATQLASLIGAEVWFYQSKYQEFSPRKNSINRKGCC